MIINREETQHSEREKPSRHRRTNRDRDDPVGKTETGHFPFFSHVSPPLPCCDCPSPTPPPPATHPSTLRSPTSRFPWLFALDLNLDKERGVERTPRAEVYININWFVLAVLRVSRRNKRGHALMSVWKYLVVFFGQHLDPSQSLRVCVFSFFFFIYMYINIYIYSIYPYRYVCMVYIYSGASRYELQTEFQALYITLGKQEVMRPSICLVVQ